LAVTKYRPGGCETGRTCGWAKYVGATGHSIGMRSFGASAPLKDLVKKFGFTPEQIVAAAREQVGMARQSNS
jgi:transketolase